MAWGKRWTLALQAITVWHEGSLEWFIETGEPPQSAGGPVKVPHNDALIERLASFNQAG